MQSALRLDGFRSIGNLSLLFPRNLTILCLQLYFADERLYFASARPPGKPADRRLVILPLSHSYPGVDVYRRADGLAWVAYQLCRNWKVLRLVSAGAPVG